MDYISRIKLIPAIFITFFIVFFILIVFFLNLILFPPNDFPVGSHFNIEEGENLSEIALRLKENGIIKSGTLFIILTKMTGKETLVRSGDYFFRDPLPIFEIVARLTDSNQENESLKITIPEGSTIRDIAEIFESFENFDKEKFLFLSREQSLEGYLFPDTYLFLSYATTEYIIKELRKNFDKKISELNEDIKNNKREFSDIIIMASLIEKELANYNDRRVVSDILWKRLDKGMFLQVDAVFYYIFEDKKNNVSLDDLKTDSPYNTYLYKGLPPTSICNPGLDAIDAAINPEESPYWYYLSDKEGNTYFAKTFEEHKINKAKYLK